MHSETASPRRAPAYTRAELLSRYQSGQRDFTRAALSGLDLSGADLSGADLSRADLSGADLSNADLRSTRLCNAHLHGVLFKRARFGATWSNRLLRVVGMMGIALVAALLVFFGVAIITVVVAKKEIELPVRFVGGLVYSLLLVSVLRRGVSAGAVTGVVAGAVTIAVTIAGSIAFSVRGDGSSLIVSSVVGAFAVVAGWVFAVAAGKAGALAIAASAVSVVFVIEYEHIRGIESNALLAVGISIGILETLFQITLRRRALRGDTREVWLRGWILWFECVGRTDMQGADLQDAKLGGGSLAGVNLAGAKLLRTQLAGATGLDRADCKGTELWSLPMQALATGRSGEGQDFHGMRLAAVDLTDSSLSNSLLTDCNLVGAVLQGANLSGATLAKAQLADARLLGANLRGANLNGADLKGADLRGASLNGADLRGTHVQGLQLDAMTITKSGWSESYLRALGEQGVNLVGWDVSSARPPTVRAMPSDLSAQHAQFALSAEPVRATGHSAPADSLPSPVGPRSSGSSVAPLRRSKMVSGDSSDHDRVRPVRVFLHFAPKDADSSYTLRRHLKPLILENLIQLDEPQPGDSLSMSYGRCCESDVLLALHSVDYLDDEFCQNLLKLAIERQTPRIVPVLLRPAVLDGTALAGFNALPKNRQPVTQWSNSDAAFKDIADGLLDLVRTYWGSHPKDGEGAPGRH